MIQSMTGFGKAVAELENRKVTVEVKSLNSKQLDLYVRMPNLYKEKEMEVRNLITRRLERGKVDFLIYVENIGIDTANQINQNVIESYYKQIKETASNLGIDVPSDWFQVLMRMPEVLKYEQNEADENEWRKVLEAINEAINQLLGFRKQEGKMLQSLFEEKTNNISNLLLDIEPYEKDRIEKVRTRITEALQKLEGVEYDKNRFEQELIYYIEKLDINEEKNRLSNHLRYFQETMNAGSGQGKKLGFICQEIGREVNTMGSKSNDAEMQQIVVRMKDELEQMKEQVLNVL